MDKEITVEIPIHLVNTPKGVSQGGILQHTRREVAISCLPDKLVDYIEVDVSGLDIGDSIQMEDIHLPEGLTTVLDPSSTIAVVMAPTISAEKEEEVEGEVEEEEKETSEAESQSE
jgi:large subunit ribosomal protein L25